jgi:hypothetical protein
MDIIPFLLFIKFPSCLFSFNTRVRFHYGHPDVFDRLFHLTRGGVSKASKVINLSEDIFAGLYLLWTFCCHLGFCRLSMLLLINVFNMQLQASIPHYVKGMLPIMNIYKLGRGEMWALIKFPCSRPK